MPWALGFGLSACMFEPPVLFPLRPLPTSGIPLAPVVDSGEEKVFEDPGNMVVYHGFACAEQNSSAEVLDPLRVEQSRTLPATMNRATVFLNGWRFKYLNGDHNIFALGTGIFNIRLENNELKWEAYGGIIDHNFDDPYRWCYQYTLLAWNRAVFAAGPDHGDTLAFEGDNATRWETALSFHPNYANTTGTGQYGPTNAAILPRGFAFAWRPGDDDHKLLQLAYDLDYSERFVADGKRYGSGTIDVGGPALVDEVVSTAHSWETKTIFKDNALKRDYYTGEVVSVVAGSSVGVVQPPFTIVPVEDLSNCVPAACCPPFSTAPGASESRIANRVPFDVAVPVLTGWDLSYPCNDQNVEEIGTWIEGFKYTVGVGSAPGVLEYTLRSVLNDEDGGDGYVFRRRVSILGFNRPQ